MKIEEKVFHMLGFGRSGYVKVYICPLCTERVDEEEFRNEVFIREFESSGLCQGCQDFVFGYKVAW